MNNRVFTIPLTSKSFISTHYINHIVALQLQKNLLNCFFKTLTIASKMSFKVLLHHYGMFTSPSGRKFVGGLIACVDPVEFETFSAEQLKKILTNCLGYDERSTTFFLYKET